LFANLCENPSLHLLLDDKNKKLDDSTGYSALEEGKEYQPFGYQLADWQTRLKHSEFEQELGISGSLVEDCLACFSTLYRILHQRSDDLPHGVIESLREEFRKFYVWNDVRGTQQGHLEQVLSTSRSLRVAILSLLVQWAKVLCKGWLYPPS